MSASNIGIAALAVVISIFSIASAAIGLKCASGSSKNFLKFVFAVSIVALIAAIVFLLFAGKTAAATGGLSLG